MRAADLLVLGVHWAGFDLVAGTAAAPRLVATAGGERVLTLIFPPQSIAEVKYTAEGDTSLRAALLASSSRVALSVPAGAEIPLEVAGMLEALARGAQVISSPEGTATAIELPWHLVLAPQAQSGAGVVSRHASQPVTSAGGVVGLWDARLSARDGSAADAGILLLPLAANTDDAGLDVRPLSGGDRASIVAAKDANPPALARATRLQLSALGGSLSARLRAFGFEWDHDTSIGRDQRVRTAQSGVLYPFGHRAVYIERAERLFFPDDSHAVAGMHRQVLLLVTEPVRSLADAPAPLRRQFPFAEVEIMQRSYTEIPPADFKPYQRDALPDDDLKSELEDAQTQLAPLDEAFTALFLSPDERPQTEDAFIAAFLADETSGLAIAEANADRDPDEMQRRMDAINAKIAADIHFQHQPGLSDEAAEALFEGIQELRQQLVDEGLSPAAIAQVRAEHDFWVGRVAELIAQAKQDFAATDTLPEYVAQQAAAGIPGADTWVALKAEIDSLNDRLREIAAELQNPFENAYWTPLAAKNPDRALQFPLRLAGDAGDIFVSMPLVFVSDFELGAIDHFDAVHSLTDSKLFGLVEAEWKSFSANGRIPLPGVRIDLVRSGAADPPPGDVHEVHAMTLVGPSNDGNFRPVLGSFDVELPALRALHPGLASRQTLTFARRFLESSAIPEMPLEFSHPLDIDFRTVADRSGGLVSPRFFADGISRTLGPAAAAALPPKLTGGMPGLPQFDPKSVFKDATLLGFPLSSLIKLPDTAAATDGLPSPPAIVQLFDGGLPNGMRMDWTLTLDKYGPFRPLGNTKLVLSVEATRAKRETTCTVNDFQLVLPPEGDSDSLLTLTFGSLRFTRREGQAPELEIEGLRVGLGGALKLLQGLQAELEKVIGLPDNRPRIDVRPTGVVAGYGVSVPSVSAGAFLIRNIAVHTGVDVPFDGKPVTVSLSFATRDDPFTVTVLTFGGGGYVDLTLGPEGLMRLEASIDFGAFLAVDFFVAKGEVHAFGGVRFTQNAGSIDIDGFVNIGGSVEVLGLVSVSIALLVRLTYQEPNRLVGRATIVVEIDLTLFADSVEIDSGEWVLAGSEAPEGEPPGGRFFEARREDPFDAWKRYRGAFAPV